MRNIDKIDQLILRINQNLSDYHEHIKGFEKDQIIAMADKIGAMNDAHMYLTEHHAFTYERAEYLLKFQNPLEIIADKWYERISDISDMSYDIEKVLDRQDAEQDGYALVGADAPETIQPDATELNVQHVGRVDIQAEAERIVAEFAGLDEPNSPAKTHFMVQLSREFIYSASSDDIDKLYDALSYETTSMSTLKGETGIFVFVAKDELLKEAPTTEQLQSTARDEAQRLLHELKALKNPNDPDRISYTAKISDDFMKQAGFQYDRLLFYSFEQRLPMTFGGKQDEKGSFLTVSNGVRKQLSVTKEKPSLLGQLADAQKEAATQAQPSGKDKGLNKNKQEEL